MSNSLDYQTQQSEAYPLRAVLILTGGLILVRQPLPGGRVIKGGERKPIRALSRRSLDRLALVALSTATLYTSLLTVSYGANYPRNGKRVKLDIKRLLQWLNKRGCKDYLWFLEFQERGAPHLHFLLDWGQKEIDIYHNDLAHFWSNIASENNWEYCPIRWNKKIKGFTRYGKADLWTRDANFAVNSHPSQWEVLRTKDGGARYAMKYALKKKQKEVPPEFSDIGRFWATPQHLSLPNLVKTWTHIDDEAIFRMCLMMDRDFSTWDYIPKIVVGNTDAICKILIPGV